MFNLKNGDVGMIQYTNIGLLIVVFPLIIIQNFLATKVHPKKFLIHKSLAEKSFKTLSLTYQ